MARRLFALVAAIVVLAACRLDVAVDVNVNPDGSGEVAVVATVDKEVVDQVPGLAGSLSLDDATAAGWVVDGPTATDDGGLTVALRHPFTTVQEAANLLDSLGPPFTGIAFERTASEDEVVVTLSGSLTLPGGVWDAFGDAALIETTGGVPFAVQLTASGATPAESMTVDLAVRLPGEITETTGDRSDGAVTWSAPLDGSTEDLATRSVLRDESGGGGLSGTVATIALVLLVVWLAGGLVLVAMVARARQRRRNRLPHRLY